MQNKQKRESQQITNIKLSIIFIKYNKLIKITLQFLTHRLILILDISE